MLILKQSFSRKGRIAGVRAAKSNVLAATLDFRILLRRYHSWFLLPLLLQHLFPTFDSTLVILDDPSLTTLLVGTAQFIRFIVDVNLVPGWAFRLRELGYDLSSSEQMVGELCGLRLLPYCVNLLVPYLWIKLD